MPSDLIDGFRAGMQMGMPILEAKLRRRELAQQASVRQQEREQEQAFQSSEREADRALQKLLADNAIKASSTDLDKRLKSEADNLSTRISADIKLNDSRITAAAAEGDKSRAFQSSENAKTRGFQLARDINERMDRKELMQQQHSDRLDEIRVAANLNKSQLDQMVDAWTEKGVQISHLEKVVNSRSIRQTRPDEWEQAVAKLSALKGAMSMAGAVLERNAADGNIDGLAKFAEMFAGDRFSETVSPGFRPVVKDRFTPFVNNITGDAWMLNQATGEIRPFGDLQPGAGMTSPGPANALLKKNKDGTLSGFGNMNDSLYGSPAEQSYNQLF